MVKGGWNPSKGWGKGERVPHLGDRQHYFLLWPLKGWLEAAFPLRLSTTAVFFDNMSDSLFNYSLFFYI